MDGNTSIMFLNYFHNVGRNSAGPNVQKKVNL